MSGDIEAIFARSAAVGDIGIVGKISQERGSGLASLVIETEQGKIRLDGDWRMIQAIVDDLEDCEVEVVEGSDGTLSIRPVYAAW